MTIGIAICVFGPGASAAPAHRSRRVLLIRAAKKRRSRLGQATLGKRSSAYRRSTFGRGRLSFSRSRLFSPTRRAVVKARVVRHKGRAFRSAQMTAHLSYLKRDGVTRSGERTEMFDASRRLRSRAEEFVAIELGPKPEHEIRNSWRVKSRRNDGCGSIGDPAGGR